MSTDTPQPLPDSIDLEQTNTRKAHSLDSLLGMLGWNSVAVFTAGEHRDGERLKVNKTTVMLTLTDPAPEFTEVVFLNGEHHHTGQLLSMEYEGVIQDHLDDYGCAEIVPMSDMDFIQRNEYGVPHYEPTTDTNQTEG